MKPKYIILSFVLSLSFLFSAGQDNFKDLINNPYDLGDTITIKLDNTGGDIQWQESVDLTVWTNIPGQNSDSLIYIVYSERYIRAYVSHGYCNPYYSDTLFIILQTPLPCPLTIADYDGNVYDVIQIGNQCWIQENLKTSHYADGTSIPYITDNITWGLLGDNNSDKAYCFFGNNSNSDYGALYTWAAVMNGANGSSANPSGIQGICPTDWHVPSDDEWKELEMLLGMSQAEADLDFFCRGTDEGSKLKETGTSHWNNNVGATNSSGFTGLPGGFRRETDGGFYNDGYFGNFWSATEKDSINSWFRLLLNDQTCILRNDFEKSRGLSVRCVKDVSFPQVFLSTLITDSVFNISLTYASVSSEVSDDGGAMVTSRGVCWNTTGNPDLSDSLTSDGLGIGSFVSNLTGLIPNTVYYVRAYATNTIGVGYGSEFTFVTLDSVFCPATVTDYDGNIYNAILIGNQCWMSENLRATHYSNGASIPMVTSDIVWAALGDNSIDMAYCYYNNDSTLYASTYGALYTWAAALNGGSSSLGACPVGWHVPDNSEWIELTDFLGGLNIAGGKMKEVGFAHWESPNEGATNSSGFTGLPGGSRDLFTGSFGYMGIYGYWWTSTEPAGYTAGNRLLFSTNTGMSQSTTNKSFGFSVRCVRD